MQRATAARVTSLLALRRLATSASRPALSAAVAPLRRAAAAVNATARWPLQPTTAAAAAALCARRGYAGGARKAKAVSDDEDDDDEEFEAMGTDEEFDGDFDDEDLEDTDDDEDDEDEPVKKRGRR